MTQDRTIKFRMRGVLNFALTCLLMGLGLGLADSSNISARAPILAELPQESSAESKNLINLGLLSEGVAWLHTDDQLFFTEDNGQTWQNITPDLVGHLILAVSFNSPGTGRMLLSNRNDSHNQLVLLQTSDGGKNWTESQSNLSNLTESLFELPIGRAQFQWLTPDLAWLMLKQRSNSNFSLGKLLKTIDGGTTWTVLNVPFAGEFVFRSEKEGYLYDLNRSSEVYKTNDGGQTWFLFKSLNLDEVLASPSKMPLFLSGESLILPFRSKDSNDASISFYATHNFGENWDLLSQKFNPTFWLDSESPFFSEAISTPYSIKHYSSPDGKAIWMTLTRNQCLQPAGSSPLLTSNCVSETLLFSSDDSGQNWQKLQFPDQVLFIDQNTHPVIRQTLPEIHQIDLLMDAGVQEDNWVQLYNGHGFDACNIPSLSAMSAWFESSPYKAVNLYIGGIHRACDNILLNADHVQSLFVQGWRFFPTWVGHQAPCTNYKYKIPYDIEDAYQLGVQNANEAMEALRGLSMTNPDGSGSVVYYDLESFTYTTACSNAVRSFLDGWTTQLHSLGIQSGLYASSRNLEANKIYNLDPAPDAAWIAEWYLTPGYRPDETVFDVNHLDDQYWSNHQRILQYSGSHDETWGGVTINIDNDVLDGPVGVPYGADMVAPITTASISGTMGVSPWYKTPVSVTLASTDNTVGVKFSYYKVDDGVWTLYTEPFYVSGSGQKTISYLSVDKVNNWEAVKSLQFYVDTTPPANPILISPGCPALNGIPQADCNDAYFTWEKALDVGVGLADLNPYEVYWGTDPEGQLGFFTNNQFFDPAVVETSIPYYLRIRTQDKQANWSAWQTLFTLFYDYRFTEHFWFPLIYQK